MSEPRQISSEDARRIGDSLGINWRQVGLEQFRMGLLMELEYVTDAHETSVTIEDMSLTGKITLAYLKEHPNYYARLAAMEAAAEKMSAELSVNTHNVSRNERIPRRLLQGA